ncbi:LLM class flavin-dependent oxidoreductase [Actinomadura sp. WMMB 499]|uniref:LLM class flavin-dependent oxidoreductase n=1 Tax=Actinomadura sp. WMMB 499 TaxID=1219491 RepID=UPI0012448EAF|nr:LLM class flavin-dependent oxidoreductase [Actinomadura sp. WMMB 499]QFG20312.1 LLM class flavin-dependent oxidoreductase [Actinomadura sp. WMMB 499]
MSGDRISFGAAAIPEPEPRWLAAAERLPIASVWQGGHVLPPSATGEAITRLALMTAWTERVRVGAAVLQLPLYHPVIAAKQLADLDARSGGRLAVGVGVGGEFPAEFEALGVPLAERGPRTDEAMQVLRTLWKGGPVRHHGRFFRFGDAELRPVRPPDERTGMRPGGPPLLVSGRKRPAMRRAARLGDGWLPYLLSPDGYARSVAAVRDEAAAAGRDLTGFEWMLYLYCSVRRDGDRARDDVASFLGGAYGGKPGAMLDRIAPAGTPDEVAARFQQYVDAGVRHFVIAPAAHADTLDVVRLAAEEVLPRLTVPAPTAAGTPR